MPEYLSPGVYVEEVDTGNKPIEGVSTSTVGFLGVAERGPTTPTLVTSFSEYVRNFGSYRDQDGFYLTHAVEGFFLNGGKRCYIQRIVTLAAAGGATKPAVSASLAVGGMTVTAVGEGLWGNRIAVKVENATLNTAANAWFKLTVIYWAPSISVPGLSGVAGALVDPTDPAKLKDPNRRDPTSVEVFDNLSANSVVSNFYPRQINGASLLTTVAAGAAAVVPAALAPLAGGLDGTGMILGDAEGNPAALPGKKKGLLALEEVDEISILCCPEENAANFAGITATMVAQCENLKYRFAITQADQTVLAPSAQNPTSFSKYSAYYTPWLNIRHPLTGMVITIPPGGHIAGIYARTDIDRGVHKAPANAVVQGIDSLQIQITQGQQDILNPKGVNVMRFFPGQGNLVWGARNTTRDPDWKYINVRRLFIFTEKSIERATQWVVFEPNDYPLWARVTRSVSDFLTRLWMDGMLQGKTKEQAYFVKCDRTTMTQADIDNGKLIMLIGIAPVKPAEFVIFRIGQWTLGNTVTEG
jgi:phage tail sheath protein FI